ncbi:hypothetical protein CY34DRAFT_810123, partial [Suillus luteus UH-Slu-Lm8-n1]
MSYDLISLSATAPGSRHIISTLTGRKTKYPEIDLGDEKLPFPKIKNALTVGSEGCLDGGFERGRLPD